MEAHAFGAWSLLPPALAIVLSILTRQVIFALAAGVYAGALLLAGGNPIRAGADAVTMHLWPSLASWDHQQVIVFTLLMGAMVGIVHRSGGMHGIVDKLAPLARSRRGGQLVTWLLGLVIFFDDYTNTLLLGTTMRPLADRLRISREKLAYLVDSTAAPVAGLAIVSTWVAVEIGFVQDGLDKLAGEDAAADAFMVFVGTIPYRFYVLWALLFVPLVAWLGRDFGPMWAAESRAAAEPPRPTAREPNVSRKTSGAAEAITPRHWLLAIGPIVAALAVIVGYILYSGIRQTQSDSDTAPSLINIVGRGDSYSALVYGSLVGLLAAAVFAWCARALTLRTILRAAFRGARLMVPALAILWLAWSLSRVCERDFLATGDYLAGLLQQRVAATWLPTLVFLIASAVAFATGTSWGTMSILIPLVVPVTHQILSAETAGASVEHPIFLASVGSVLAGSIFGDHCSPISDTTVLSSLASGCHHLAHVWTQLPYALVVALVSVLAGTLPVAWGVSVWWLLAIGPCLLVILLRCCGRRVPDNTDVGPATDL
jgi:Na+/H+ antiporter NhaC